MTDQKRPHDFSERLQRIEKARQNQPPVTAEDLGIVSEPSPYDPPVENHTVRNALIWMVLFITGVFGSYQAMLALPDDLKALVGLPSQAVAMTHGDADGDDTAIMNEAATPADLGLALGSPHVANGHGADLVLTDIAKDVTWPTAETPLGRIITFDRNVSCTLRRPLAREKVINVRLEAGQGPAPLRAFSNADLAATLLETVTAITQGADRGVDDGQATGDLHIVDVLVTDTSAPVYLALQNTRGGILWNIHAAPDVTIAHIAMITAGYSGVVNLPNTATLDALHVGDFVGTSPEDADFANGDCMIAPWRKPQPDWIASHKAASGNTSSQDQIANYERGYAAYSAWYASALGVSPDTNLITARTAAHVLAGPVPDQPVTYQTIAGQAVHIMRTDTVVAGDTATRTARTEALQREYLAAAIGGEMSDLDPPMMERVSP